mmetsp:Transcript_26652/g.45925  ORF Transcript_26652/g.45925 Transcript_26652/m.45925 type:complete len:338 (+) Transcript_26652:602-1615(+)
MAVGGKGDGTGGDGAVGETGRLREGHEVLHVVQPRHFVLLVLEQVVGRVAELGRVNVDVGEDVEGGAGEGREAVLQSGMGGGGVEDGGGEVGVGGRGGGERGGLVAVQRVREGGGVQERGRHVVRHVEERVAARRVWVGATREGQVVRAGGVGVAAEVAVRVGVWVGVAAGLEEEGVAEAGAVGEEGGDVDAVDHVGEDLCHALEEVDLVVGEHAPRRRVQTEDAVRARLEAGGDDDGDAAENAVALVQGGPVEARLRVVVLHDHRPVRHHRVPGLRLSMAANKSVAHEPVAPAHPRPKQEKLATLEQLQNFDVSRPESLRDDEAQVVHGPGRVFRR